MSVLLLRWLRPLLERFYWLGFRDGAVLAAVVLLVLWVLTRRRQP